MSGSAFDAHDDYNLKGLKQQQAVTQVDTFTISTAPSSKDCLFSLTTPHASQLDALPAPEVFLSAPIYLSGDPRCPAQAIGGCRDPTSPVLPNQQLSVDTEQFSGILLIHIKDYPGTSFEVFRNSRWLGQTVIQGRFKQPIAASDLWVGQELWNKPLLPASFQKLIFSTAAKLFSSTSRVKTDGEGVGFLNPLLAMAHVVNVSTPGSEPDIHQEVVDDVRLMCSSLADKQGKPLGSQQRQRHFDRPSNLAAVQFDSEHVYTFVIGQSILDMMRYKLALGGLLNLDLCPILNGQPLQMMCKNIKDNKTILSVLVWHERLNYPAGCKASAGSLSSSRLSSSRLSSASSSCSTLNDRNTLDGSSSSSATDSIVDCCCSSSSSSRSDSGDDSSSGGRCSLSSSGCCSSDDCCGAGMCDSWNPSSSNSRFDVCADDDMLSEYYSACSHFSCTESAGGVSDVGNDLLRGVGDMLSISPSSTAGEASLPGAAANTLPTNTAASEQVHRARLHGVAAAAARHRKQKHGSASKRFKAWLKKMLK